LGPWGIQSGVDWPYGAMHGPCTVMQITPSEA